MSKDPSNGYEAIAQDFIAYRSKSTIGVETVRLWAHNLTSGAIILDLGCGSGIPITKALVKDGYALYGIDASPALVTSFRKNFPDLPVACEPVESSDFFNKTFDGVVAWGLIFLLSESEQVELIHRISSILSPGGRFLFTSPEKVCTWTDSMTGSESRSLGAGRYRAILSSADLPVSGNHLDEGNNYYYFTKKE
jgi:2-polyprenyl-3-methyl-5-hydroxy-6-metoxy-1,4-benzoquinol methylase